MDEEWASYAKAFSTGAVYRTIQGAIMLYNMGDAPRAQNILEIGAGTGLSANIFVGNLMKPGAIYYVTDIASVQIEATRKAIAKSDWIHNPANRHIEVSEEIPKPHELREDGKTSGKTVVTALADGERLPFDDNTFDCLISNLVLQGVPDHSPHVKEALRVLKPGGKLACSIIGRYDQTTLGSILETIYRERGVDYTICSAERSDKDQMRQEFLDAGFKPVKAWHT